MIKRYSFPSQEKAQELILKLVDDDSTLAFNKVTVTSETHGLVCLGFQHKYENGVLIKESTTYDVDVFWKGRSGYGWASYEVSPVTPNHNFY